MKTTNIIVSVVAALGLMAVLATAVSVDDPHVHHHYKLCKYGSENLDCPPALDSSHSWAGFKLELCSGDAGCHGYYGSSVVCGTHEANN